MKTETLNVGRKGAIQRPSPGDVARYGRKETDPDDIAGVVKAFKETREELKQRDATLREWTEKAAAQIKETGAIAKDTKDALEKLATDSSGVHARLLEVEQKMAAAMKGGQGAKRVSLGETVTESDKVKTWLAAKDGGKVTLGLKSITSITSGDGGAGDLIVPQRLPGIIRPQDRPMTIRDLLASGRTSSNSLEYVQETGFTNNAAPVAEGAQKPESSISFSLQTAPVRTLAHWMQASKQVLDDVPALQSYIDSRLRYGLEIVEEDQILAGDGTGQNLLGLIPQATAFDRSRVKPGDTRIDIIRRAMTQVRLAEYRADAIVMHPVDWEEIELTKDANDRYIWANPNGLLGPTLWGRPVIDTTAVEEGEFLVGAFKLAAQVWDREDANVQISTEDRDNFIKNMVTIRGEERLALTVFRPEAIVTDDFDEVVSS